MRLNRTKFLTWLNGKMPFAPVGSSQECHTCPIANFYRENGQEVIIFDDVNFGDYYLDRGYARQRAPLWMQRFIRRVDRECSKRITAQRAIEILATC